MSCGRDAGVRVCQCGEGVEGGELSEEQGSYIVPTSPSQNTRGEQLRGRNCRPPESVDGAGEDWDWEEGIRQVPPGRSLG